MGNPVVRDGIVGKLSPLLFLPNDMPVHLDTKTGVYSLASDSRSLQAAAVVDKVCGRGGAYRTDRFMALLGVESPVDTGYSSEKK